MTIDQATLLAMAQKLVNVQHALVAFSGEKPGEVAQLDPDTVDDLAMGVGAAYGFCVNHPPDKPYLPDVWLWLAVRCWKMGKAARDGLPDPREGLPEKSSDLVMDQVAKVNKGEWSPQQAAVIRKALAGEMPMSLWNLGAGWRTLFGQGKIDDDERSGLSTVIIEDPETGEIRDTEQVDPSEQKPPTTPIMAGGVDAPTLKPKKRKIKIKVRKPRKKK